MSELAEQPQQIAHKPKSFADPERARQAASKSHEARRFNKLTRAPSPTQAIDQLSESLPDKQDSYTLVTLSRVRYQLERLHKKLSAEEDPARIDRLAAAFSKLAEVERQLAGRPLPGSLRPTGRPAAGGMIEQPQASSPGPSSAPPVQSDAQE